MKTFLAFFLAIFLFPYSLFALSEKEFQQMYNSSQEFQNADKILNKTWKEVNANLSKNDRQALLKMQREWLKNGRDEEAKEFMALGYSKDCAYAIASIKWAKQLEVFEYNANLSPEAQERGAYKADDAFWDEETDIPANCKAK